MAFELWPPSTPPVPLRRIDNIMVASPSGFSLSSPALNSNGKSRKHVELKDMFRDLPPMERIKRLQEFQLAKNRTILDALENERPRKSSRRSLGQTSFKRSYFNMDEGILGCRHYQTNVSLAAPCCGEFFVCRFCHDAIHKDHKLKRQEVNQLCCLNCGHVQGFKSDRLLDDKCESCQETFARYFCSTCRFYDNDDNKDIFHCDQCGVCRVGKADEFFHCQGCGVCISNDLRNKHRCVNKSAENDCAICTCSLSDSCQPESLLPCGHVLHTKCLDTHRKTSFRCPTCLKSLGDMKVYFAELDRIVRVSKMPVELLSVKAVITCADCEKRSTVPYHYLYHKCSHCGSYSTNVLEQHRA